MNVLSKRKRILYFLWMATSLLAWGKVPPRPASTHSADSSAVLQQHSGAEKDLNSCGIWAVTTLPGTHEFASNFIEAMVNDPAPDARDGNVVWALTADLNSTLPGWKQALYISRSINDGKTWTQVARVGSKYFDVDIGEGLRNGLAVSPDGRDFVITTQEGAFQVIPQRGGSNGLVESIAGPRVPAVRPNVVIAKKTGEPVRAGVVKITADGEHMIIGYGYFDLEPQLIAYHRSDRGSWIEDGPLPHLPTDLDIFSMDFDRPEEVHPGSLYVGTGDQVYRLDLHTRQWTRVDGVGPDSAIHGMSTVGGLHLAACWGVYNPVSTDLVARVTDATFLLHPAKDEAGPNIRAYGIAVDPLRPNREILTAITGVYASRDNGKTWNRMNDLPEEEFHIAHFNADGTVIVSGPIGTFVINPFSDGCVPHLKIRDEAAAASN